jgi:hypothetical protein
MMESVRFLSMLNMDAQGLDLSSQVSKLAVIVAWKEEMDFE